MLDLIIKNGLIADGTGNPAIKGDIAVKDGRLVSVGADSTGADAKEVIDAAGLLVAPGFIDSHTHSDKSVFTLASGYNYLEQGVTTQVAGQCGSSPAPFGGRDALFGEWGLDPADEKRVAEICATPSSFMGYAKTVTTAVNMAFLLGHGAVRNQAMGYSDAKPSGTQMDMMKRIIKDAMDSGYLGYSSGLAYAPSVYADTEELIELARVMAPYGGVYASHIRSEGLRGVEAVAEALRVGEEAGVTAIISHLKVVGKQNEGDSAKLLAMIDEANAKGYKAYADQYPFPASSAPLASQIPPRFHVGGEEAFLKRLEDPAARIEIESAIFNEIDIFESAIFSAGYDGVLIAGAPKTPGFVGKTVAQISRETGKPPMDAFLDLLIANKGLGQGIYFSQNDSDLLNIIAHPKVMGGSDWSDYERRVNPDTQAGGHPRGTATFPRRLELIRDKNLLTPEESIRRITALPAEALGLAGRGLLKEGYAADITILDYSSVKANADFLYPFKRNDGIVTVIVNGVIAVNNGVATGAKAGMTVLRGNVK